MKYLLLHISHRNWEFHNNMKLVHQYCLTTVVTEKEINITIILRQGLMNLSTKIVKRLKEVDIYFIQA